MEWEHLAAWCACLLAAYITYVFYRIRTATDLARTLYGFSAQLCEGHDYMWKMDSLNNLMNVNMIYVLEGKVTAEDLRKEYEEKVVNKPEYARFRQRIVCVDGLPFWVDDSEFDLKRHIVDVVGGPKTQDELLVRMGEVAAMPFPVDRPLWKMEVTPNYEGTQTLIIERMHHVIGDGVGMVTMLFRLFDPVNGDKGGPTETTSRVMRKTPPNKYLTALAVALMGPWLIAKVIFGPGDRNPWHGNDLGGKKRVALSPAYDIAEVKEIKNHYGVTINDALMGIFSAAINRCFKEEGDTSTTQMHVCVPVNLRVSSKPAKLENKFSPALVPLPVHTPDPEKAIQAVRAPFAHMKHSIGPLVYFLVGSLLGSPYVPEFLGRFLFGVLSSKMTTVVTNVPGPQEIMLLAHTKLLHAMFWVPSMGYVGMGVSIVSYGGRLQFGVSGDEACVRNPKRVAEKFDEVFRETLGKVRGKDVKADGK